jgi:hypothetical protein
LGERKKMIAELAAFNAAFGVVKQALSNGRDIADCAKQIGVMIGAQEECRAKSEKKSKSIWFALAGKDTNDFEEFMALEKMKTQRAELLQTLQLFGRPRLKGDFLKFEADARKRRREEAEEAKKQKEKLFTWVAVSLLSSIAIAILVGMVYFIGLERGRW